jgi:uncharacterized membrane protein HdeD (DUF308 family)
MNLNVTGLIWIIAGIIVLAWPDAIRWTIGIGAIVVGVLLLMTRRPGRR